MTIPKIPDLGIKGPWEPHQNMYNLLLSLPDFQLRALAQIYLNSTAKAELWLSYSDEYRITLVSYYHPNSPSSVYLPYLYDYALCVTGGITPPEPDMTISGIFDITTSPFNGQATYVSPSDHGYDNTQAIDDAIDAACQTEYGGIVFIPGGNFWSASRHRIPRNDVKIIGAAKRVSYIYHEPTDYDGTALFQCNADDTQTTTLYGCQISGLSIRGDNPDLMSVAARNARQRKIAIQGVCTSGLYIDVDINKWNTGSDNYTITNSPSSSDDGGSIGYLSQGKELTYIVGNAANAHVTDMPYVIEQNPKEPGNQIDCDAYTWDNSYAISVIGGNEYIMSVASGLNFIRPYIKGQNIWAGGAGGIYLVEEIADSFRDLYNFDIDQLVMEQMTGGSSIKIHKKGGTKLVKFNWKNISCNFDTTLGIDLNGALDGNISGAYPMYTDQTGSELAVKLAGVIKRVKFDSFLVPSIVTNGADLIDEGPATATRVTTDRTTAGTAGNQLDTICIYNT